MRFCDQCDSIMRKTTSATGTIMFQCVCGNSIIGSDDDTLMYEHRNDDASTTNKHEVLIDNSPYDMAANRISKDCPKCGLNFLTQVRIGAAETTIFTCSCGFRATYEEYAAYIVK
jgi:DNA-directed RNA polymerase subunit M/transcription elongation factor TFIIS